MSDGGAPGGGGITAKTGRHKLCAAADSRCWSALGHRLPGLVSRPPAPAPCPQAARTTQLGSMRRMSSGQPSPSSGSDPGLDTLTSWHAASTGFIKYLPAGFFSEVFRAAGVKGERAGRRAAAGGCRAEAGVQKKGGMRGRGRMGGGHPLGLLWRGSGGGVAGWGGGRRLWGVAGRRLAGRGRPWGAGRRRGGWAGRRAPRLAAPCEPLVPSRPPRLLRCRRPCPSVLAACLPQPFAGPPRSPLSLSSGGASLRPALPHPQCPVSPPPRTLGSPHSRRASCC
jgi:hypothetical protein